MPLPIIAAAALPAIVATAIRFFIGSLIARFVLTLGIAIVSFALISTVKDYILNYISTAKTGITGDILTVINMIGVFDVIDIIASAYVAAIAIRQLRGVYNKLTFGNAAA